MATRGGRYVVSVYSAEGQPKAIKNVKLPTVFSAPVRADIISKIFELMNKNRRMPHGVSPKAGHQTSAASWGTGRAVARIPRVRGGGTHRSGQGAFGNMCRGGHMFSSKKIWRRFHRKVNIKQKRYALCSAIAGSGSPALVMAKGHQIARLNEIPLVVQDKIESLKKTKDAVAFLKRHKVWSDIIRVYSSMKMRPGKGKRRNRRFVKKRGPLIVYNKNEGVQLAFRNIPGVETICVDKLNLIRVAPGGVVGRLIIWTESALAKLDKIYGTYHKKSTEKKDFNLPQPLVTSADLMQILRNESIKNVLRAPKLRRHLSQIKLNPLKNKRHLYKLNPYAEVEKKVSSDLQTECEGQIAEKKLRIARRAKLQESKLASRLANIKHQQQYRKAKALERKANRKVKAAKPKKVAEEGEEKKVVDKAAAKIKKDAWRKKKADEGRELSKAKKEELAKSGKTPGKKEQKKTVSLRTPEQKKLDRKMRKMLKKKTEAMALKKALAKAPEIVAMKKEAAKVQREQKAAAARKIHGSIMRNKKQRKELPALRKAKAYRGKNKSFGAEQKSKNEKASNAGAERKKELEKIAGIKFLQPTA